MKDSMRARVAGIVGAVSKGQPVSSIFDYSAGGYRNISVSINNGQVSGYDYSTSSHFSGGGSGNFDFFDYETSNMYTLKLTQTILKATITTQANIFQVV